MSFAYGADRARFKQVNGFTGVDGLYERESGGATTKHIHYIVAGGAPVAIYESRSDSTQKTRYVHRDHLGNITHLTNESGAVVETLSYDPWGKRRNADWSNASGPIFPSETSRGFTGHEQLDDVTVIHMNGRAYDPDTGRMLSPDPYVQAPDSAQSFNRFAYVFNNPLRYTDPSGYCTVAGPSCPLSGFGGFSGGYAAPRIGLSRQGIPRTINQLRITTHLVPTLSLGSLGLPSTFSGSSWCTYCLFETDHVPARNNAQFGLGWSVQVSVSSFSWTSSPIFWPNNEGGNTQAVVGMYEQNYGGTTASPLLAAPGSSAFSTVTGFISDAYDGVTSAADRAVEYWIEQDIPIVSPVMGTLAATMTRDNAVNTMMGLGGGGVVGGGLRVARYAAAKVIGSAQTTGTLGHALVSRAIAYAHALNPNVQRVTLDLGYRKLFEGTRAMVGKWGPRPDVGVLYRNGQAKIVEVLSRTDNPAFRQAVHDAKWVAEGLGQKAPVVFNEWARRADSAIRTVGGWFK